MVHHEMKYNRQLGYKCPESYEGPVLCAWSVPAISVWQHPNMKSQSYVPGPCLPSQSGNTRLGQWMHHYCLGEERQGESQTHRDPSARVSGWLDAGRPGATQGRPHWSLMSQKASVGHWRHTGRQLVSHRATTVRQLVSHGLAPVGVTQDVNLSHRAPAGVTRVDANWCHTGRQLVSIRVSYGVTQGVNWCHNSQGLAPTGDTWGANW